MKEFIFILFMLLVAYGARAACPSPTYVDSYSSLPPAPLFPTTYFSSLTPIISSLNPLTQNHWSETANISAYRPPPFSPSSNPSQTNCPHLQLGLKYWHDPSTWTSNSIPSNNNDVNIPPNTNILISSCSIDPSFIFGIITVPSSPKLIFADAAITINAKAFKVAGSLLIGSETCRLRSKITITLHGKRSDQTLPGEHWVKGIAVNGIIDIHGTRYFPTWTRLAITAKPGDSYVFIQDVVNWQPVHFIFNIRGPQTKYSLASYFLEDGVEENNIISYNQASYVHPLGKFWNPSINAGGDNWWLQYLATYPETPNLILPSDMAAGCFYITNTFNDVYGNAASGGWAGFSIPSLSRPVKLHSHITNAIPANRPFKAPFRGNSAHSTGYWWRTAGGIYVRKGERREKERRRE